MVVSFSQWMECWRVHNASYGFTASNVEILKYVQFHWIGYQYNIIFFWLLRYSVSSSSSVFFHNICSSYFFTISVLLTSLQYLLTVLMLPSSVLPIDIDWYPFKLYNPSSSINVFFLTTWCDVFSFRCNWRISLLRQSGGS